MTVHTVSFQQISKILEVTGALELNHEGVEIPVSTGTPSLVRRLSNGKLEIIVDTEQPFDQWPMVFSENIQPV